MPSYRYLLCDLLTDQQLAVLPLSGVSFDKRISRTGSLNGTLNASTPGLVGFAKLVHAYAGRSALYAFRDRELWWGGIPWTVLPKQDERGAVSATVTAATFDSYAHHRRLYANKTYTATDQGILIPDLWRTIQSDPRGDIGMVAEDQLTGVLRDRTYLASEHGYIGKMIEDLGDVIDGPEHTVDVYLDGAGNRVKRLRVANQIGTTDARVVFQRAARGGGRVLQWAHAADASNGGTTFQTRGDAPDGNVGEDTEPALSHRFDRLDLLDQGWPLLDVTEDRPGATDQDTLDGWAEAMAEEQGGSAKTSSYTVQVGNTGWSPNRIGDAVRLKLDDDWHTSTDITIRPVGCRVTPAEKGVAETVQLLLGDEE